MPILKRNNPDDTLLVNGSGPRRSKKRTTKSRRAKKNPGMFGKFFSRILGGSKKRTVRRTAKGSVKRTAKGRRSSKRNPLLTNPLLTNPLLTNGSKRGKYSKRRSSSKRGSKRSKRNPLLTNPLLTNPSKTLQRVSKAVGSFPIVGGLLGGAIGVLGSAIGGGLGVLPTSYLMPHVSRYMPSMLRPYGYTIAGVLLSSAIRMIPINVPYKKELALGVAAAGGAVDVYRFRQGKSQDLGDEMGDDLSDADLSDAADMGDLGELGDDGSAFAAIEFADADLADADLMGDEFSADEVATAALGRRAFWRKYGPKAGEDDSPLADGVSEHAGKPGRRHAILIYWLGFDGYTRLTKLSPRDQRDALDHMKKASRALAQKLLAKNLDTSIRQADVNGLLVAA